MPDRYVLDANCFIEPHKRFYPFDIAPGYWQALKGLHKSKRLCSIDRVKAELLTQKDRLSEWVKELDVSFFKQTRDQAVLTEFTNIMTWVQENKQFTAAAKAKFARVADGWLVAFAKVTKRIVVTQEVYDPRITINVPIPNLCEEFNIEKVDLFEMLRALEVKLTLKTHV